jgi:hypothetical protein
VAEVHREAELAELAEEVQVVTPESPTAVTHDAVAFRVTPAEGLVAGATDAVSAGGTIGSSSSGVARAAEPAGEPAPETAQLMEGKAGKQQQAGGGVVRRSATSPAGSPRSKGGYA